MEAVKRRHNERPVLDDAARRRRRRVYLDMLKQDSGAADPYPELDALLAKARPAEPQPSSPTIVAGPVGIGSAAAAALAASNAEKEKNRSKRFKKRLSAASKRLKISLASLIAQQEAELLKKAEDLDAEREAEEEKQRQDNKDRGDAASAAADSSAAAAGSPGPRSKMAKIDDHGGINADSPLPSPKLAPTTSSHNLPSYLNAAARKKTRSSTPPLCAVCGLEAPYTCVYCGERFCCITCQAYHMETRCA